MKSGSSFKNQNEKDCAVYTFISMHIHTHTGTYIYTCIFHSEIHNEKLQSEKDGEITWMCRIRKYYVDIIFKLEKHSLTVSFLICEMEKTLWDKKMWKCFVIIIIKVLMLIEIVILNKPSWVMENSLLCFTLFSWVCFF